MSKQGQDKKLLNLVTKYQFLMKDSLSSMKAETILKKMEEWSKVHWPEGPELQQEEGGEGQQEGQTGQAKGEGECQGEEGECGVLLLLMLLHAQRESFKREMEEEEGEK